MNPSDAHDIWLDKVEVQLPNSKRLFQVANWKIPHGSHVLVQGPSGCGKTTLLHLIAGLFQPSAGQVLIGDTCLRNLSDAKRCDLRRDRIGVVFQKLNLLGQLTVRENIELGLGANHPLRKSVLGGSEFESSLAEVLGRVRILEKIKERCSHLSLGEQQRVAVARVLAQRPTITLADEPTSSLDRINADFVMEALKEAARGRTLIVVSHDERVAKHFDRVFNFSEIAK